MSDLLVSLQLERGQFELGFEGVISGTGTTGIIGPSGCGKTTLLKALAGLLPCSDESLISFDNRAWQSPQDALPTHERRVGFVFQSAHLFPHLTVQGNLGFAEDRAHNPEGPSQQQVVEWLQLDDLLDRATHQLSRGQQQRVAIARALLSHPDILFLDEPLANLDRSARDHILTCLQQLQRELSIPMLYVSHDMDEISRLAEHLLIMEAGRILASGPAAELTAQLDLPLARDSRANAILHAQLHQHHPEDGLSELSLGEYSLWVSHCQGEPGSVHRVQIAARDVSLCLTPPDDSSMLNILPATILELAELDQHQMVVQLEIDHQLLLARLTRRSVNRLQLSAGKAVYAQIKSVALLSD